MKTWTKQQQEAIYKEGCNILVSAGAGSGKTAVLTERVIQKVKQGIPIISLLILTFTKAAAKEMKERIRTRMEEEGLKEALDQLDLAYITTFDSFALSIIKRYHYILNISSKVEIAETSIIDLKKEEILDRIFLDYYEKQNSQFGSFIQKYCMKDDTELKKDILNIDQKLDLKYQKEEELEHYISMHYTTSYFAFLKSQYQIVLLQKQKNIEIILEQLKKVSNGEYEQKLEVLLKPIINAKTYNELKANVTIKLPMLPKDMAEVKPYKEKLSVLIKELNELTSYDSEEEMMKQYQKTEEDAQIIIEILIRLNTELKAWKIRNNLFEFHDIAKMAIQLLEKETWIKEDLKNQFYEILLDEYQDTNDLQELFIQKIQNHNLYMVGDMKQSIYRFRNANPNIFKEKYEKYRKQEDGYLITLRENFRSRKETLEDINFIFNRVMQELIGGVNYQDEQQMIFGNPVYINPNTIKNSHMEYYEYEEQKEFTNQEIEAFFIAQDIQHKIDNQYQVLDQETKQLRNVRYSDFAILMDRTKQFNLYQKIFEYLKVPLTIYQDEVITTQTDIKLLYHILRLMDLVENNIQDQKFIYSFVSVSRSYLIAEKDDVIFETIQTHSFDQTIILQKIHYLLDHNKQKDTSCLFWDIIEQFNFYQRMISVGKIEEAMIRIEYLQDFIDNLVSLGYCRQEITAYLEKINTKQMEIKISKKQMTTSGVLLMTIHKSKGLEFPICYYSGLYTKFNKQELIERFSYDDKYGLIIPIYENGIQNIFVKRLVKHRYELEEISERIRLFYVALTRCKEKIILIAPKRKGNEYACCKVDIETELHYQSFLDILLSILYDMSSYKYEVSKLPLTKDYKWRTSSVIEKPSRLDQLTVTPIEIDEEIQEEQNYSKKILSFLTKEEQEKLDFGITMHKILERTDIKNKKYPITTEVFNQKIEQFLNCELIKENIIEVYQEYKVIVKGQIIVIDLMIEYEDEIDIIDYKLKNINDIDYTKQLLGYQEIIKQYSKKRIRCYLYAILTGEFQEIK